MPQERKVRETVMLMERYSDTMSRAVKSHQRRSPTRYIYIWPRTKPSWSETQVWVLLRKKTNPMNKETASEKVNAPRPEKLKITFINSLIDEMENACGPVPFIYSWR